MEEYKRFEIGETYEPFNLIECQSWLNPIVCIKRTNHFVWFKDYDFCSGDAIQIYKRKINQGYGCENVKMFNDTIVYSR